MIISPLTRRSFAGYCILSTCAFFGIIYGITIHKTLTPRYTDDYKRTFVTNEFGIYPPPISYQKENFLAVKPGENVNLASYRRYNLHFYSWTVLNFDTVYMRRAKGKIFFLLRSDEAAQKPVRATLNLGCSHPIPLRIRINTQDMGIHSCIEGNNTIILDAPKGLILPNIYSEIEIARPNETWQEKAALWFDLRDKEVSIAAFRIDVVE